MKDSLSLSLDYFRLFTASQNGQTGTVLLKEIQRLYNQRSFEGLYEQVRSEGRQPELKHAD